MNSNDKEIVNFDELVHDGTGVPFTLDSSAPLGSNSSALAKSSSSQTNVTSPNHTDVRDSRQKPESRKRKTTNKRVRLDRSDRSAVRSEESQTVVPPEDTMEHTVDESTPIVEARKVPLPIEDEDIEDNIFLDDDEEEEEEELGLEQYMTQPEGLPHYTIGEAIFLILRNDMKVEDAEKTLIGLSKLSPKTWGDLTRCFTHAGGNVISPVVKQTVKDTPPRTYLALEGMLVTSQGANILNYPEFVKAFISVIPRCSYSNWKYYYNSQHIATMSKHAFNFSMIDREIIASVFKLYLPANWETEMTKFRIMMVFCSNGIFKVLDGKVVYEMIEFRADDSCLYDRFSVPNKLFVLRQRLLQGWMEDKLKENKVTKLHYSSFDFVTGWNFYEQWAHTVSKLMSTQTLLPFSHAKEKAAIAKHLNAYSGNNKSLRSMVNRNKDFFIQTPEFDYFDISYNYMPRRVRNSKLREGNSREMIARDPNVDYDWTGTPVSSISKHEVRDFKTIMVMYTNTIEWLQLFASTQIMVHVKSEQDHSLNIIFVRDKQTPFKSSVLGSRWYAHVKKMYDSERRYMINMILGQFEFTGTLHSDYAVHSPILDVENDFLGDDGDSESESED
jgi:hypothetical protein